VSFQTLSDIKAVFFDAADGGVSIWHVILFLLGLLHADGGYVTHV
jgi:hypothetical protein